MSYIEISKDKFPWIENYIRVFDRYWRHYLGENERFFSNIYLAINGDIELLGIEFMVIKGKMGESKPHCGIFERIIKGAIEHPLYIVEDEGILIVKENKPSFWSKTMAIKDMGASLGKRMLDTMPRGMVQS